VASVKLPSAMKGVLEVPMRFMAVELGPRGISVNAIAPGPVANDFFDGRYATFRKFKIS